MKNTTGNSGWNHTQGTEFQLAEMRTGEVLGALGNYHPWRHTVPKEYGVRLVIVP